MAKGISAAVGKGKKNNSDDVKRVQELLNQFSQAAKIRKLKVDGDYGPKTAAGIAAFQFNVCKFKPDFVISPGKTTIKKLMAGPAKLKSEAKAVDKAKAEAKKKAVQDAVKAAQSAAKSQKVEQSSWGGMFDKIETYADELYDDLMGIFESKSEATPKDAKKIAEKVIKEAQKKAADEAKSAAKEQEKKSGKKDKAKGDVTGKTNGVDARILNIFNEVSAFYGKKILVVSGLRSKEGQAKAMFSGWNGHLKHGNVYIYLAKKKKLREELDDFRQADDRNGFVDCMMKKADWNKVSMHLTGRAADVSLSTDKKVIAALATCLKHLRETNSGKVKCHHFDLRKCEWPIKETTKAKWKL